MNEDELKSRVADLEKTLRNIVAIGDRMATPASRLVAILDVAEKALHADDWSTKTQVGGIPA